MATERKAGTEAAVEEKGGLEGRAGWPGTPPKMRNREECPHGGYDPAVHGSYCPDCGDYMGL